VSIDLDMTTEAGVDEGPDVSGCGDPNCEGDCGFAPGEAGGHPPQITNPTKKYVVVQILLDENGTYSVQGPCLEQGGTIGYGDTTYGQGPANIDDTALGVGGKLKYFHEWFMAVVAEKKKEADKMEIK